MGCWRYCQRVDFSAAVEKYEKSKNKKNKRLIKKSWNSVMTNIITKKNNLERQDWWWWTKKGKRIRQRITRKKHKYLTSERVKIYIILFFFYIYYIYIYNIYIMWIFKLKFFVFYVTKYTVYYDDFDLTCYKKIKFLDDFYRILKNFKLKFLVVWFFLNLLLCIGRFSKLCFCEMSAMWLHSNACRTIKTLQRLDSKKFPEILNNYK